MDGATRLIRRLDLRRLRRGLKRADVLICVSEATAERCQEGLPQGARGVRAHRHQPATLRADPGCGRRARVRLRGAGGRQRSRPQADDFLAKVLAACPEDVRNDLT